MIRDIDSKWVEELSRLSSVEELPSKIAELAEIVGIYAALKVYIFYSPLPTTFPQNQITQLKKIYIQKKFGEYSAVQLARILGVTPTFVYNIINAVPAKSLQTKMFD
jgi:hypothetical protein